MLVPGSSKECHREKSALLIWAVLFLIQNLGGFIIEILSSSPLSPETFLNYLTENGFIENTEWKQKGRNYVAVNLEFCTKARKSILKLPWAHRNPQFPMVYGLSILPLSSHPSIPNFHGSTMEHGAQWFPCLMIILHYSYPRKAETRSSLHFYFWNGKPPAIAFIWEHGYLKLTLHFPHTPLQQGVGMWLSSS